MYLSFQATCKIFTTDEYKCRGEVKLVPVLNWSPDCEDIRRLDVQLRVILTLHLDDVNGKVQALDALIHSETVLYCPLDMRLRGPQC